MNLRKYATIIVTFFVVMGANCGQVKEKSAEQMIRAFYTQYIEVFGDHPQSSDIKKSFLTPALIQRLKAAELDYDPFLNAQDCDKGWLKSLSIVPVSERPNYFRVSYSPAADQEQSVVLRVIKDGKKYLIDDVEGVAWAEGQPVSKVKYYFNANGDRAVFYNDGTAYLCAGCLPEDSLEYYNPNATYTEDSARLVSGTGVVWDLFDQNGRIVSGWEVMNYRKVESPYSITGLLPYTGVIDPDSVFSVDETCFIELLPETRHFEDENTPEADAYFIAMDDRLWYISETRDRFKEMGVQTVVAKKRYLVFLLAGGEKGLLDTRVKRHEAILYKKGHMPIFISIADNDVKGIKDYLSTPDELGIGL